MCQDFAWQELLCLPVLRHMCLHMVCLLLLLMQA